MLPQGQLDWFPILHTLDHLLDHAIRQGQADYILGRGPRLGRFPREGLEGQARLWDLKGRHRKEFADGNVVEFRGKIEEELTRVVVSFQIFSNGGKLWLWCCDVLSRQPSGTSIHLQWEEGKGVWGRWWENAEQKLAAGCSPSEVIHTCFSVAKSATVVTEKQW